ncbi:GNAT family N-acetyltransferase [Phaeovulum sp. W22_SRMD_FR3]|uniref:GNAT family N-acetyltransferase n=1 Tax=Phaeovulum sp. W22_SRMD_FR3 TaxID=3240274 RepID=UPI003F956CBF
MTQNTIFTSPAGDADVTLVPMTPAHLDGALALSQAAGWPHRREDWANFLGISQGIVALCAGEVVGTGMCSIFDGRARLSLIIVSEKMRSRGLGRRIMTALIALGGDLPMSLTATEDGFPLYRKLGFETATTVSQYQGIARAGTELLAGAGIRRAGEADMAALLDMDRKATGAGRAPLLQALAARGKMWIADKGFACLVPFGRGLVLGPLAAADLDTAQALLAQVVADCDGMFLRVDTDPAQGLVPMLTARGLMPVGDGTVMHRSAAPVPEGMTAFALASQALG